MPECSIVGISVVKNEADVIETMARHNLGFVDHLHIIDNYSADGTYEILKALGTETGCVSTYVDSSIGFPQHEILTKAAETCAKRFQPDHLVFLDADEFIKSTRENFREQFFETDKPVLLPWTTYVPTANDDNTNRNLLKVIQHRRVVENPQYFKTTMPKKLFGNCKVMTGAHGLISSGKDVIYQKASGISLAHFPARSPQQILSKILLGSWNLRLRSRRTGEGYHWHEIAREIITNGELKDDDFFDLALNYAADADSRIVFDPMISDPSFELKFVKDISSSAFANIVQFTEQLVSKTEYKKTTILNSFILKWMDRIVQRKKEK